MSVMFWQEFGILFVAALLGAAAVVPYSMRLAAGKTAGLSKSALYAIALGQSVVIFGITIWLGLVASHTIGLGAPYIESLLIGASFPPAAGLFAGILLGAIAGAVLLIADLFFIPYWPQSLRDTVLQTTSTESLFASFYGGINEELIMRLFGLSSLAWLLLFVMHSTDIVFWIANILMTILFGLGHLPALKAAIGSLPMVMVIRSLLLNAPVGLLCGWLFWSYGIEAAILAHFAADIIYHVFGTAVIKRRMAL